MYSPRRSLDDSPAPGPSSRRRKTVSFTELPLQPARVSHVPSYKSGVPPPRTSILASKHRRHDSSDQILLVQRRNAGQKALPDPIMTPATPIRQQPRRAQTLDDEVAHSPWARPDKEDSRRDALVSTSGAALWTPPVDDPISLPLPPPSIPPSPASSTASFFSDTTIPYTPLPSPYATSFHDLPLPSPVKPEPAFSPMLASSLLLYCAAGTIVQEAATKNSLLFFTLDLIVFYTLFFGALYVFGWSWLLSWHTLFYLIVLVDITSLRERHLLEFGVDPHEDIQRLAAAGSDSELETDLSVAAKLERRRSVERAPWTPAPYLMLSGALFLAFLHALVAARMLFPDAGYVWFNLGTVVLWQFASFLLERQFPQCLLYSRPPKVLFRKHEVESIVGRQALHRLAPPALLALTYYALCTLSAPR